MQIFKNEYTVGLVLSPKNMQVASVGFDIIVAKVSFISQFFGNQEGSPRLPWVLAPGAQLTADTKQLFVIAVGSLEMEGLLSALPCVFLQKELELLWILASGGGPGTNPHAFQGTTVVRFGESQKVHVDFQLLGGQCPNLPSPRPVLFKNQYALT